MSWNLKSVPQLVTTGFFVATTSLSMIHCGSDEGNGTGQTDGSGGGMSDVDAGNGDAMAASGGAGGSGGQGGQPNLNCGNMVIDEGEDCDDGKNGDGDGCDDDCKYSCQQTTAGNINCQDGFPCNGREVCGPDHYCIPGPLPPNGDNCGVDHYCQDGECLPAPEECGDGIKVGAEECDDGKNGDGDGCDDDCRFSCSNGVGGKPCVAPDECAGVPTCDDDSHTCVPGTPLGDLSPCPSGGENAKCISGSCTTIYCSNGTVDPNTTEECDDGNVVPGDGCEPDCTFTCEISEDCDPGDVCLQNNGCNTDTHVCNAATPVANGSACGTGLVCVNAICRPTACRDGALDPTADPPEECDDGNNVNGDGCDNDCTFSCEQASDCTDPAPVCREWSCENHRCVHVPTETQGQACTSGTVMTTCKGGACTTGTCGPPSLAVDSGEECDLGEGNGPNTGCEEGCRLSCNANSDCDNSEVCDGMETCRDIIVANQNLKQCAAGIPLENGTSCGDSEICINGVCRQGYCGDGFADPNAGEECDPPSAPACSNTCEANTICDLTGRWAHKLVVNADWTGSQIIESGSGVLTQWLLVDMTQTGTVVDSTLRTCGLQIPDFQTTQLGANELYGISVPNGMFDSGALPAVTVGGSVGLSPGSAFSTASASVQLGIDLDNDFGPWPDNLADVLAETNLTLLDPDADSLPGFTAPARTGTGPGGMYTLPAVNLQRTLRADRLSLVVRQIASQSGTLTTCDEINGVVNVSSIDNHIIGCRVAGDPTRPCTAGEYGLVDTLRPRFTPRQATFRAIRVAADANCAAARAALP